MNADKSAYRAGVAIALGAALLLLWLSLGVSMIGKHGNPANLWFLVVIGIGVLGAMIARFRPHGMALALFAMAVAQAVIAAIAAKSRIGIPYTSPLGITGQSLLFIALFVGAGALFQRAANAQRESARGDVEVARQEEGSVESVRKT